MNTTTKLMTLLLAMLASINVGAQGTTYEYVPFVREGVKWVCFYDNPINAIDYEGAFIPYGEHYYTLELKGDTVINGKSYKPLHLYSGSCIDEENDTVPVYLREENKIIYGIIPDDARYFECPIGIGTMVIDIRIVSSIETGKEFILYDFNNLESFYMNYDATASFYCPMFDEGCSAYTDTVLIGNQLRKRLVIHSPYSWEEYIIEGLGFARNSLPGNPFNYFYGITTGLTQVIYNLCHVIEDGKIVHRALWCQHDDPDPESSDYEYVPFVREGVKWVYAINDYRWYDYNNNPANGDFIAHRTLELRGDTIINGKLYKAMHKCVDDEISEPSDVVPIYLREEDKKVYGIVPDSASYDDAPIGDFCFGTEEYFNAIRSGEEFLLYDFQDPINYWDSISLNSWDPEYYHLYVDTIAVGDHLVKSYHNSSNDFKIIEGIGLICNSSYPLGFFLPVSTGVHCEYFWLETVIEDGEVIYGYNRDKYMPLIREGVQWVNERVVVNNGDTTRYYYTYEFKGNHPKKGDHNCTYKALYRYDGWQHELDVESDSLVAGLREDWRDVQYFYNEPLNSIISQGRDLIEFDQGFLYQLITSGDGWGTCKDNYIEYQKEQFLNNDNFFEVDPITIDGYRCSRLAYLNEQGDTVAYIVEGIGFDSRDMGDLLTPFTRKPDPNADYQEWCGLSHVIKDGKIIYKGMCYNPNVEPVIPGDANGDGEITIADANSVIDIVIMGGNASHPRMPAIDMNDDGEVTIADVNVIIDIILNNNLIY